MATKTLKQAIKEEDKLNKDKQMMKSLYLSSRPMMGYDKNYVHFIFAGARGRGKSVISLDAPINSCEKYGYENNKIYFFRLSDLSVKALLANSAVNLVDPILIDRYKMNISRKGNIVYNNGKKLLEVYSLASAAKMKGQALYDYNFLNNRPIDPKTGKRVKRFIWLILDEFQIADGLERQSAASRSTAALWHIYTETILRDQQFLDYPAVKCIYCANSVSECSTFTTEMWGYYMPPGQFKITKCKNKNAVFFNIPNSEAYVDKRKKGITGSITDFDNDSNYSNQIRIDMSQIKPHKTRIRKVTQLIMFSKSPADWFCLYDSKYMRQYRNEKVNKNLYVSMKRHLEERFNEELVKEVFERYDNKTYIYTDVKSMAVFRARMKELKNK